MGDRIEDGTEPGNLGEKKFVCPVCGRLLHKKNLLDMESIIYDNLYHKGRLRICSSRVHLCFDFKHCYNEEGFRMDDSHSLVGVVDAEFDQAGDCTRFVLKEIRAADNAKSIEDPRTDRRVM